MSRRAWALALLWAFPSAADAAVDDDEPVEIGKSAAPIVGFDQKRGWFLGAAGFLYTDREPGINAGFYGFSNGNDFHSAGLTYEQRGLGPWSGSLSLMGNRDFDNYYGEGDLTSAEGRLYMRKTHAEARPALFYRPRPHLRLGAFVDYRFRHEEETRLFPDESSSSPGLHAEWDTRDKLINPRKGDFLQLNLSVNTGEDSFTQLDLDLRRFIRLRRGLVFATRAAGATSMGRPSYLFRYRLGGLHLLRGYRNNRFRGLEFFAFQEELRWSLLKWLALNASVDLGGIRDEAYHQLKATAQIGLRLGLPPGYGQKMRLDFGAGADEASFQIQFGEVF